VFQQVKLRKNALEEVEDEVVEEEGDGETPRNWKPWKTVWLQRFRPYMKS
jgi:hypothetical protein